MKFKFIALFIVAPYLTLGQVAQGSDINCTYTPPTSPEIRPGLPIRFGGYFYAGTLDIEWFAQNFDLLDLNTKTDYEVTNRLKEINPHIRIFQQFLTNQITINQTGAQAVEGYQRQYMKDWLLKNKEGIPLYPRGPLYLMVDQGKDSPWATYFVNYVTKTIKHTRSNGIVLDEIPLTKTGMFSEVSKYENDEQLQDATYYFLNYLKENLDSSVLINVGALHKKDATGNTLWDRFSDVIDGAWHEGWVRFYGSHSSPHTGDSWESDIKSAEIFSYQNKPYIASGAYSNKHELEYVLANYLLAVQSKSLVFQPMYKYDPETRGGFNFDVVKESIIENKDLFNINLGCAIGHRTKHINYWTREYRHGIVIVNPSANSELITYLPKGNYINSNGKAVSLPIKLNAFSGLILYKKELP
ncbi:MAG: putative glycoside hydrolase [Pseudomonadota bacterium]|nr:putative glycoside hydrolase [Pseudomonadota bacterium]